MATRVFQVLSAVLVITHVTTASDLTSVKTPLSYRCTKPYSNKARQASIDKTLAEIRGNEALQVPCSDGGGDIFGFTRCRAQITTGCMHRKRQEGHPCRV